MKSGTLTGVMDRGRKGGQWLVAEKKQLGSLDQPISRLVHVVQWCTQQGCARNRSRERASLEESHGWTALQGRASN